MQCIILAAGYATRLSPLTDNFPKPLLEVGGKSILDWMLDDLEANAEISRYVLVSNHKFLHHFQQWARRRPGRIVVVDDGTVTNEGRLGAVRDIQLAMAQASPGEATLVAAGDNLLDFSLAALLEYFRAKRTTCIMRYEELDDAHLRKCGVATVDGEERVVAMTEKSPSPPSRWVCPAFYCFTPADLALVPVALAEGCSADAPGSFVAWLAQRSPVHAMRMPGKRLDIGDMASYRRAQELFGR